MRIRTKITLSGILIILLAVGVTIVIAIQSIVGNSGDEIKAMRDNEMSRTKENLRNIISIAYEILEGNFVSTTNRASLEARYGQELMSAVSALQLFFSGKPGVRQEAVEASLALASFGEKHPYGRVILWVADAGDGSILSMDKAVLSFDHEGIRRLSMLPEKKEADFFVSLNIRMPRIAYVRRVGKLVYGAALAESTVVSDAQELSKEQLRRCLYDEGTGYVFAFTTDCVNLVHPHLHHLENTDYSFVKDSLGNRLVVEMINKCLKYDEGFVEYRWPKHRRGRPDVPDIPKITYVRLFKPWMWMIGSGEYIDRIDALTAEKAASIRKQVDTLTYRVLTNSLLICLGLLFFSIYFSRSISRPLEQLTRRMQELSLDGLSANVVVLKGPDEIIELGGIFNRMLRSLQSGVERMREAVRAREKAEGELGVVGDIQNNILPQLFPPPSSSGDFDIYAFKRQARESGAHASDFFITGDKRLCMMFGDAAHPGVSSSLYMVMVRAMLRAKSGMEGLDAGGLMTELNAVMAKNRNQEMNARVFLGILDMADGRLNYCNAGYNFPMIVRNLKQVEEVPMIHGEALGLRRGVIYSSDSVTLEPSDFLIMYSDGLRGTFTSNGRMDTDGLIKCVRGCLRSTAEDSVALILREIECIADTSNYDSDMAFTLLSYHGGNGRQS